MGNIDVNGQNVATNEEGFLLDPDVWSQAVAAALAKKEEGIKSLSEDHWAVIDCIREYYTEKQQAPMVRKICQQTGFPLKYIYQLFPSGPAKGACKVAGLPKPDGCV
ncbi:MAG: TusE/DsrC/DsvC family sulfur relay protein [Acidobacteria bacterium]|nr:TusE/DsrC/DsvC family sulfur relay protein [Acidobacteriota bacterium]